MENKEVISEEPKKESTEEQTEQPQNVEESSEAEASGTSSWWGGYSYSSWMDKAVNSVSSAVESAKIKSNEVYGLVSKDLEEVSTHANTMVRSSSTTIKKTLEKIDTKSDELADQALESVKSTVTSAWKYAAGYANQMFKEEDLESEALLVQGEQEPVILNRLQAQLYALGSDPETFLSEPHDDDKAEYDAWQCDLDKRQGEISDLMVNSPNVRKNYSALVPEKVTHKLFWTRYFFKVHLIELQENRRQVLKKRAAEVASQNEEINWDDVADLAEDPIPTDVQDKLLNEYEKELIESKVSKVQKNLKKELNIKDKQITPDKDETSSDDWEKLSSGSKSPRKQSKDGEDEDWVQT